jgi:pilus assembly protein Flp/PilA
VEISRNEFCLKVSESYLLNLRCAIRNFAGFDRTTQEAGLKNALLKFLSDESGATAIEYGLIAAGISIAILAAVNGLGSNLNTMFSSVNSSLK